MNFSESYVKFLRKFLKSDKKIRVVFDFSNGVVASILKRVINSKISPIFINDRPDGNFPAHGPNPLLPGAMSQLQKTVLKEKADLGVAYDADGDRAFFVDNKGRILPSHIASRLFFLKESPPYISDVVTYKSLEKSGFFEIKKVFPTKVGTYLMKKALRKRKANFGVEYSGHFYFKDFFYADSGILSAIKIINAVSGLPYSLADFVDLMPEKIFEKSLNLKIKNPQKFIFNLKNKYWGLAKKIEKIDGLAFDFGDYWMIVRSSNTEPLVRLFFGAKRNGVGHLIRLAKDVEKII